MSEWKETSLANHIKIKHGYAFKGTEFTENPTKYIVVTPGNFFVGGGFKKNKLKYLNNINPPKEYIFNPNDVIVTMTDLSQDGDTLGYSALVPNDENIYLHNQRVGLVQFLDLKLDKWFLYWLMRTFEYQAFVISSATGTAIRHTSPKLLTEYKFFLPPLPEQEAIAEVLSSLDDKIDLLHRNNKTLEQLAETLFRQWFVEEADDSWETVTLKSICERITKGTTPTTLGKAFASEGINFIKAETLNETGGFVKDKLSYIDQATHDLLKRSQISVGDILFTIAGTIGRTSIAPQSIVPANTNQAVAIIRVNKNLVSEIFMKYVMKSDYIQEIMDSKIVHAVQPNLSLGEISETEIKLPPNNLLKKFDGFAFGVQEKIENNNKQIQQLETIRDTMLPKLMNGSLKVRYKNEQHLEPDCAV
ncbi:restriction endonuclease subunit S [uncultured Mucilaginibacter sp.]|uniref:restriction endonuclease subunit S n=1 Tax=uncultured Mucilaginibacter sp. TaxID=797541 RepID=UPI0025F0CD26|nr:restriction endonuclease subunit S [uncultured Mucilaginibacter sp.]